MLAFGPDGQLYVADTRNHAIRVISSAAPVIIASFRSDRAAIEVGGQTTLRWTTSGATSASLDPGIGAVAVNGNIVVAPSKLITYTLTVRGEGGTATATTVVVVGRSRRRAVLR